MSVAIVTGSAGLIGSEACRSLAGKGFAVVGIDNDMRQTFFGPEASTGWSRRQLEETLPGYRHYPDDIRDADNVGVIFAEYGSDIKIVVHTAAQPSHDWAVRDPLADFSVNAVGTLVMLEATRRSCPRATFIYTSTSKVYGDNPNRLPFEDKETRWEVAESHPYFKHGIDESMSIDQCTHSLFGVSKASADLMVQEYGRYFGMKTGIFRPGCLTGGGHSGAELHGFLSYLMKCVLTGAVYKVIGYGGKQVRDNIHSSDLVNAFWHFHLNPRPAEVYNLGGGRWSNCSLLEAVTMCEHIAGKKLATEYVETPRIGDHRWWIGSPVKFMSHYPAWSYKHGLASILADIYGQWVKRLRGES